ncbi:MAG TPA: DoxX family membrane protein [Candidatus Angelobacter sp.]
MSPPQADVTRHWTAAFKSPCAQPEQKLLWLKVTLSVALIGAFGLTWRLWVSSRLFPLSPVTGFLPVIPFPLDVIWLGLIFVLLLAIVIVKQPRKLIFSFLVFAGLLSLWDQMRWQPWFYQCFLMLAAMGLYAWKKPDLQNQHVALNACRVIVAFTYFWSGVQKLNVTFVKETWPDISGPFLRLLPQFARNVPPFLLLAIPLFEILTGLGLITRRYRNAAAVLAIGTHIFVLMVLISSGENTVVWPWNITMVFFVLILFWQDKETSARSILLPKNAFHAVVLLLFGVLPAFSLIGLWDSFLSSALYSGNTDEAIILVSHGEIDHLPESLHTYAREGSYWFFLDVNRWAYGELNVPVYPEPRIYRSAARQICRYGKNPSEIKLMIRKRPGPTTGHREDEFYDCDHLF